MSERAYNLGAAAVLLASGVYLLTHGGSESLGIVLLLIGVLAL
jgi:hypothetical protein